MKKLSIKELRALIFEAKKEHEKPSQQLRREIPQIPYPEVRTTRAIELIKTAVGKELTTFGVRTLLAALVDLSFSKLHKISASNKDEYDFYQHIYLEARQMLAYAKENSPF